MPRVPSLRPRTEGEAWLHALRPSSPFCASSPPPQRTPHTRVRSPPTHGTNASRGWVEERLDHLLARNDCPIARAMRRREAAFATSMREWIEWREKETQSMQRQEAELRRRAEWLARREASLLARETALRRGEAKLQSQMTARRERAARREHTARNDRVVELWSAREKMRAMETELEELRSLLQGIPRESGGKGTDEFSSS